MEVTILKNLRAIRKARGLTVRQCAEAAGVTHSQFTRYEGLKTEPTWATARKIAAHLGVTLDELAGNDGPKAVAQ